MRKLKGITYAKTHRNHIGRKHISSDKTKNNKSPQKRGLH